MKEYLRAEETNTRKLFHNSEAQGGYKKGHRHQANMRTRLPGEEAHRKRLEAAAGLRLYFGKIIT